ncbi:MAG: DUF4238 domain-containing protein [Burkholderiales bacterium]|uniref:DUF4238 domain-containing protein n=1 Tax=Roseateles sp. TaxID=1971397 RepID=UPI000FA1A88C|nr:MAG: DUF4238 domain-containing protein [Burkholderiales bacterium]
MGNQLQHYVPRFLLRQFGSGKKDHVRVYDKQSGTSFAFSASKKSAIAVAAEYHMYDFEFAGEQVTIEPKLADLESKAAEFVVRLVREERFDFEEPMERATLASFLAVQMVRTRAVIERSNDVMTRMKAWLEAQGGAPEGFFDPDPLVGDGVNADRAMLARLITQAIPQYAPTLVDKDWVLLKTDRKHPFLMGDHPFATTNERDSGLRGNLGIACKGIQIYFPLSPTLALGLWCPTLQDACYELVERLREKSQVSNLDSGELHDLEVATITIDAIENGTPLRLQPVNVVHFNSLQVRSAERFVFGPTDDFSLVKEMVASDASMQRGPRYVEATGKF